MRTINILYVIILGSVICTFSIESLGAIVDSSGIVNNEPNIPVESRDEYTALINGKEIKLSKELKLSEVFKTLGDPEDIDQGNYGLVLYCWGLGDESRQSIIIEAQPKTSEIADWMVINYEREKAQKAIAYSIAGKSRYRLIYELNYMRKASINGAPSCPGGLWCSVFNRSKNHGMPFEILEKYDIVGPAIWVTIHNEGLQSIKTSGDPSKDVFLTVITPDGHEHISKLKTIDRVYPQKIDIGRLFQVSVPFFSWVTDSDVKTDVPIGIYRYYATFLGARSRVQEVEVHRRAFVIDSPNSDDEEIVIIPYYDKLPIHGLDYDKLIKECESVFENKYEGAPDKVAISAYYSVMMEVSLPNGGHGDGSMRMPRSYPLNDFAEVKVRKKGRD